ncbi:hypothetical protein SKAU_G00394230 [Synaphobranchus kaupii]|uniref:Uncharacterized protein n=1 Tax=Synaphobranchus kaupii TaxID=118154 RepID=A0A9Q1EC71_SYNKA|nr:hypothetical protein SKAU_G00394230 [Synaphobranchus kaupii]
MTVCKRDRGHCWECATKRASVRCVLLCRRRCDRAMGFLLTPLCADLEWNGHRRTLRLNAGGPSPWRVQTGRRMNNTPRPSHTSRHLSSLICCADGTSGRERTQANTLLKVSALLRLPMLGPHLPEPRLEEEEGEKTVKMRQLYLPNGRMTFASPAELSCSGG